MSHNRIGNGTGMTQIEALKGLLDCPSIRALDIKHNSLTDPNIVDEIFAKMPALTLLECKGNEFSRHIKQARRTIIFKVPTLEYLDESPVTEDDRRLASAFMEGEMEAMRREREVLHEEKKLKHRQHMEQFDELVNGAKEERKKEQRDKLDREKSDKTKTLKQMLLEARQAKQTALQSTSEEQVYEKQGEESVWKPVKVSEIQAREAAEREAEIMEKINTQKENRRLAEEKKKQEKWMKMMDGMMKGDQKDFMQQLCEDLDRENIDVNVPGK